MVFWFCALFSILSSSYVHGYMPHMSRSLKMSSGLHGENFKFMPMVKGSGDEHFPRIINIAGVYPGLSPEDVLAPSSTPAAEPGFWAYSFPDPDDPNVGTVAVPGSDVITSCVDPVAIISKNTALNIQGYESEVIIIIDRADIDFSSSAFYAFRTDDNEVRVMWADSMDDFHSILGKVVVVMLPPSPDSPSSGFLENE